MCILTEQLFVYFLSDFNLCLFSVSRYSFVSYSMPFVGIYFYRLDILLSKCARFGHLR